MATRIGKLVLTFAVAMLLLSVVPPGGAAPPRLGLGVAAASVSLDHLPPQASADRLEVDQFTPGKLKKYDVLVLDAATLADLLGNPGRRNALEAFLAGNGAIVVEGDGSALAGLAGAPAFRGGDVPHHDGGAAPLAVRASGLYRSPLGTWESATLDYGTAGDFSGALVADAARWLRDLDTFVPRSGNTASAADNANWQYWGSASYSYTWSPYGRISYVAKFYYSISDSSTAYDWWNVEMTQTSLPGNFLWGNAWRTNVGWLTGNIKAYNPSHELVDFGPGNLDASGLTLGLNFEVGQRNGVEGSTKTSTQSFGYTLEDMISTQASSTSSDQLYIRHEFGYASGPASGQWSNKPAFTVRVNDGACMKIPWTNKIEWLDYGTWSYYSTWISSWREVCKP